MFRCPAAYRSTSAATARPLSRRAPLDVGKGLRLRTTARAIDMLPGGIAHHCCARWNVACNDAPSADDRIIADRDARQDDRASADPHVSPDFDSSAELEAASSPLRVARVVGGIDLHGGTDLRCVADADVDHIENDAVEVQKYSRAEADVETVITEEGRPNLRAVPDCAQTLDQ